MMSVVTDIKKLQDSLEKLHSSLNHNGLHPSTTLKDEIGVLIDVLQCPVFESIVTVQQSLSQLKDQLSVHPSILPVDFDINPATLELKCNYPAESESPKKKPNAESFYPNTEIDANFDYDSRTIPSKFSLQKYIYDSNEVIHQEPDYVNISLHDDAFRKGIADLAEGRYVQTVELYKPEGQSLGFKVVGLNKNSKLGIYIQEIHDNGIAARNGLLKPGDQILAIDRHIFTSDLSHEDAINILQSANGVIQLVVARVDQRINQCRDDFVDNNQTLEGVSEPQFIVKRTPSEASDSSKDDMVLNTEWALIESIELESDGSGFGFGIVGGRSSGVIVKSIVPGGPASKDNRLHVGDHILRINSSNMRGMASDQVAQILRQSGSHIKLIIARPVDPTSDLQVIQNNLTIVPTKSLNDAAELAKQIQQLTLSQQTNPEPVQNNEFVSEINPSNSRNQNPVSTASTSVLNSNPKTQTIRDSLPYSGLETENFSSEMETFDVELVKDQQGLGITIAGYVCDKAEEISGIFIKSIAPGSVAELCQKIQINDQIIEVDGHSLYGYNNLQAVDLLRCTGKVVKLKLARYLKESKYNKINQGVSNSESHIAKISPQPNVQKPRLNGGSTVIQINANSYDINIAHSPDSKSTNDLIEKWSQIVGPDFDIIVANVSKFCHDGGLGISLEGTIDIENGKEVRPHHYINSILPNGPVGRNGLLRKADELLEVNGIRLHGLRHSDVLPLLKDLPIEVQLVCARQKYQEQRFSPDLLDEHGANNSNQTFDTNAHIETENVHGFLENSSQPFIDRLVKAKSDGSLEITPIASLSSSNPTSELSRLRSRSLEPLSGLAMWNSEPQFIELMKGDRGLGFSILDYQDPMNPNETVIVIRSLVPGGVAQQDGQLLPGDRLMFVNEHNLVNATLDQAVQALKGAPKGLVIVGVAKPLPLPESTLHLATSSQKVTFEEIKNCFYSSNNNDGDEKRVNGDSVGLVFPNSKNTDHFLVEPSELVHNNTDPRNKSSSLEYGIDTQNCDFVERTESKLVMPISGDAVSEQYSPTDSLPNSAMEILDAIDDVIYSQSGSLAPITTCNKSVSTSKVAATVLSPTSATSSASVVLSKDSIPAISLPISLEKTIHLRKRNSYLGMMLTLAENAADGYVVKSLDQNGLIFQDSRIVIGDYIVALNNKSLRNVTNDHVISILHECQLSPQNDLIIKYIHNADAQAYIQTCLLTMKPNTSSDQSTVSSISIDSSLFPKSINYSLKDDTIHEPVLELDPKPTPLASLVPIEPSMIEFENNKLNSPGSSSINSDNSSSNIISSALKRQWGTEITIELNRDESKGFGISIIGGKNNKSNFTSLFSFTGILIKKILPDSPAAKSGILKIGDKLLEVDGVDLRNATHEEAVEAIKKAKSPVKFIVQSLVPMNKDFSNENLSCVSGNQDENFLSISNMSLNKNKSLSDTSLVNDNLKKSLCAFADQNKLKLKNVSGDIFIAEPTAENNVDNDISVLNGALNKLNDVTDDAGPNNVSNDELTSVPSAPKSYDELSLNEVEDDEFGYSLQKIRKKYSDFNGSTLLVDLHKGVTGLGISLAGNRDRTKMSVFICGMHPKGSAFKDGRLRIGDEILEVNGIVLYGRSHLNASAIIKSLACPAYRIIVLRRDGALEEMAVKPLTQFPVHVEDYLEEKYCKFKGVRPITVRKGSQGLGIMIIEGKHSELGRGVFVSDIQEGSAAENAGLNVGDMILCVNQIDLIGADYDTAANALKFAEGLLNLVIAKPGKSVQYEPSFSSSFEANRTIDSSIDTTSNPDTNSHTSQDKAQTNSSDSQCDFKTCQVKTGEETTIEIVREKLGLGLSIVGGSDTPLNAVIIHEVYPNGAADIDGRLKTGDQILEVNGEDLRHAPHEQAIKALRQTPPIIKMKIFREKSDINFNENLEIFHIKLVKKPGKGLGLSIVGKRDGSGIFISEFVKGGIAELDGRLMIGDQIIQVNGQDLINIEQVDAAIILKTAKGVINLKIGRYKCGTQMNSTHTKSEELAADETKEIEIEKGPDGLGFSIVGGHGSVHGNLPVCVRKIFDKGAASVDGRLREGDIILAVNGIDLGGLTRDQVVDILKNVTGKVKLLVYEGN